MIPTDAVKEEVEGKIYSIRSQTNSQRTYTVNIELYECDCDSFPVIQFCKHLCAVQSLYLECDFPPSTFTTTISHHSTPASTTQCMVEQTLTIPSSLNAMDDDAILATITEKLQQLAVHAQLAPSPSLTPALCTLGASLDQALQDISPPSNILPVKLKILPNKCLWPEMANVMSVPVKSKQKAMHDAAGHSGGEKSGKKAKGDV